MGRLRPGGKNQNIRWERGGKMGLGVNTRETAKIEGHLRVGMDTQCSGIFQNYVKTILMKFPNNKGDGAPNGHLLASSTGLHPTELLVKKKSYHGNSQTTLTLAKTMGCLPQTQSKTSFLKTALTLLIKHQEAKLVPTQTLYLHLPWYRKVFFRLQKRNLNTSHPNL